MLKKSPFSAARPRRAETRSSPSIVLASLRPATYPSREKRCSDSSGLGGWKCYAFGLHSLWPCWTDLLSILLGCDAFHDLVIFCLRQSMHAQPQSSRKFGLIGYLQRVEQ
jgi:hypothetical protein